MALPVPPRVRKHPCSLGFTYPAGLDNLRSHQAGGARGNFTAGENALRPALSGAVIWALPVSAPKERCNKLGRAIPVATMCVTEGLARFIRDPPG
ncbi:hypothetical protein IT41_13860 [Paracoccus halophilus]|uniref:Uncharacterized protein n=1 Tax=Paracoccus halophilus TaxID=376733 RepID=A0A099EZX4_9RHOB|nr:hypothetical protein IT41_13860 [Paracoccus halophilus]